MAAPIEQLIKVGFNFRQAEAIHALDDATGPTARQLVKQGNFSPAQSRALLKGTPSPDGGVTPYAPPSFQVLVREGKFTRHQAKLIRQA